MRLSGKTIGFALAGSHCTLEEAIDPIYRLREEGADIVPIVSNTILTTETRFGTPEKWLAAIRAATGREPLKSIPEVEPLGPQRLADAVVICPCTGTTMAKLANAITDRAVLIILWLKNRASGRHPGRFGWHSCRLYARSFTRKEEVR